MAETRTFHAPWLDVAHLVSLIDDWLGSQEFETQTLPTPGGMTVQARKTSFMQHGIALTVQIAKRQETVQVEVGTGKWALHAVEGVAALVLFWPLMAIPAWAAYRLKETIDDTWDYVERYVAVEGDVASSAFSSPFAAPITSPISATVSPEPVEPKYSCPACGHQVSRTAKFCANCGSSLERQCAECGAQLAPGQRFCEACGAKVDGDKAV